MPPVGRRRYFHKLYALDEELEDCDRPTKAGLLKAMQGHVVASAELVGTYEKKGQREESHNPGALVTIGNE